MNKLKKKLISKFNEDLKRLKFLRLSSGSFDINADIWLFEVTIWLFEVTIWLFKVAILLFAAKIWLFSASI